MIRKYAHIFLLFIVCPIFALAQETIIVGDVYDKHTGAPIENANIYFKGTTIGTTSNAEGLFMLRTQQQHKGVLMVSSLGYKTLKFKVEIGQYVGIQIEMEENSTDLQDVFVLPGANPALSLMDRVRACRQQNDVDNIPDFIEETTEQTQLFVSNIERRTLQRRMWKSLQHGLLQVEDSSYLLPLYNVEQDFSTKGGHKVLQATHRENAAILSQTDYSILLDGISQKVNFYRNTVSFFGKNFISPLASSGNMYYSYYLADSAFTARGKKYMIHFKSKNPYNLAFQGSFSIDSATYALQDIDVSVPAQSTVNYLSSLRIRQQYSDIPNALFSLQTEDVSIMFDFSVSIDSIQRFPTVFATRQMVSRNPQMAAALPVDTVLSSLIVSDAIDNLNDLRLIKFAKWVATIINTGYIPAGYIDIGKVVKIINFNSIENVYLGVPIRTSEKLMENICLEGYAGYGFGDKAWKYMGQVQFKLPLERRHILGAGYSDSYTHIDVDNFDRYSMRENGIGLGFVDFTTGLFGYKLYTLKNDLYSPLTREREVYFWMENDFTDNYEMRFDLRSGRMNYGNPLNGFYSNPYFRYHSFSATARMSWSERTVDLFFKRVHLYNNLPVLYAQVEVGDYYLLEADNPRCYGKLSLMLRQNVSVGMLGEIDYLVRMGYIFGDVPYSMLAIMQGNQTWAYDRYRFSLMNCVQYLADKYVLLHAHWDMGGILFGQIPGVRRLRLHELLSMKVAYGGLRESQKDIIPFVDGIGTFNQPYVEVGVGIGNILRVLNIQSVWRLTNRKDTSSPLWGVRFNLELSM